MGAHSKQMVLVLTLMILGTWVRLAAQGSTAQEYRNANRGVLGIGYRNIDAAQAQSMALADNRGTLVVRITLGGAANKAGLQRGDFIVAINQQPIAAAVDLHTYLDRSNPGDVVEI